MKQKSRVLLVLLALGLFLSCARIPQKLISEKPVAPIENLISEKVRDAIVLIKSGNASGTGFFVAPDKIATNIHVVAHPGPVFVKSPDRGKNWKIEGVVAYERKNKLVILKLAGEGIPLPLGNSDRVQIGESVLIPGYPDGEFKVTEGSIQSIRKNNKWFRVNTTTSKETNGSPVLNDKGQVIAVIVPYNTGSYSYAMPSSALEALLDPSVSIEPLAEWQKRKHVRAAAYYGLGGKKLDAKDYAGAIVDFNKAIELNPEYIRAYYERGRAEAYLDDYNSGIASWTQILEVDPNAADAYYGRGSVKARLGDYAGAIIDLDKAIELDAQHAYAYSNRGAVKLQFGKSTTARAKAAIVDCDKAIEIDPEHANAYNFRGVAKLVLGDHEGAILDFSRVIQIAPEDNSVYHNRGWAQFHLGESATARGNAKEAQNLYNAAIGDYTRAIQINPENTDAYNKRGVLKCKLGDIESARGDAEKAQGLYREGIIDYGRSIEIKNPEDTDVKITDLESQKARNSTVRVVSWSGNFHYGSGFFVDKNKIVTNFHVIAKLGPVFAMITDKEEVWAVDGVTAYDTQNDLVILKIAGEGVPLPLDNSDAVKIGDVVTTIGYRSGTYKTVSKGTIQRIRSSDKWLKVKINLARGSSGSPVINSSGQVVGIVSSIADPSIGTEPYSYAIPSNILRALLTLSAPIEPLARWYKRDRIRAYAKYAFDQYKEAVDDFNEIIRRHPEDADAYTDRAWLKLKFAESEAGHGKAKAAQRLYEGVIEDYTQAIRINPKFARAYNNRGVVKLRLGSFEGALFDFSRAIEINPEDADAYSNRGQAQFRFGASEFSRGNADKARELYEGAIEDYTQVIKLNPEDTEAYSNLGSVKSALTAMLKR